MGARRDDTSVSGLLPEDIRGVIDVLVNAFWTYPETLHLLTAERTRRFGLTRFMHSTLGDAQPSGEVLVARDGGSIVGAAIWKPPARATRSIAGRLRQGLALLPVGIVVPSAVREAVSCSNEMRRRRPGSPHHYLAAIGVHPHHQGRGIGGALLEPVLGLADEEGAGCYLSTATQLNVSWYMQYGFKVSSEFRPTRRWPTIWTMWRDPRNDRVDG